LKKESNLLELNWINKLGEKNYQFEVLK